MNNLHLTESAKRVTPPNNISNGKRFPQIFASLDPQDSSLCHATFMN